MTDATRTILDQALALADEEGLRLAETLFEASLRTSRSRSIGPGKRRSCAAWVRFVGVRPSSSPGKTSAAPDARLSPADVAWEDEPIEETRIDYPIQIGELVEWRMNRQVEEFLDQMTEERNLAFTTARESLEAAQKAFMSTQQSIDAAPQMLTKASEVLKEATD